MERGGIKDAIRQIRMLWHTQQSPILQIGPVMYQIAFFQCWMQAFSVPHCITHSCLVIISCYLPRCSKSCQPSSWRNPDANCYSAVLRLCAEISSSCTALHCRSVTHWEYNSEWADLRYGGEVQIVAQKRLFGLVWPDTFHCGSQCWWVGISRSRKEPGRRVLKFVCPWLLGLCVSVDSVCHACSSYDVNLQRTATLLFFLRRHLARVLSRFSDLRLRLPLGLLSLSAYTVLKYEKLH